MLSGQLDAGGFCFVERTGTTDTAKTARPSRPGGSIPLSG